MKLIKTLWVLAVVALAPTAFAGTAMATTLETNGVTQTGGVTLEASLTTGTSLFLSDTSKTFGNTCTKSTIEVKTSTATGFTVSGSISTLAFSGCTHEKVVVNNLGTLSIERIGATTNGTVRSTGASVTMPLTLGGGTTNVACTTNTLDLGTLTGAGAGGTAEIDLRAVISCGFVFPSLLWEGTYVMTIPGTATEAKHAVGVVA